MTDVFISYKRRLRHKVELIATHLESLGVDVWYDAELVSGSTFSATISHHVRSAKCVLVCWSNDAFPHGGDKHGWVVGEATIGRERGVLVSAFLEQTDLDPPWNTVHTDDLTRAGAKAWRGEVGWHNIVAAIGKLVGRPGLVDYDRALNSKSSAALEEWARRFPSDPAAAGILVGARETELADAIGALENRSDNLSSGLAAAARAISLIFVVALLVGGGAGFWAWKEGFVNLDALFGENPATASIEPDAGRNSNDPSLVDPPTTTTTQSTGPLAPQTAEQAVEAIDPAGVAGSQSLLLEASDDGTTGAVPFSGTVDWSKGTDEAGQPTLIGKANIPARNLSVDVLIRKNSDPSLPASHLMEINFSMSGNFVGGSIAGLPGVLLKNEELVQGVPLVGASARVVGNSFLFALSTAPEDRVANISLLSSRKWMDLAMIYASGKRAIVTLEKDDRAESLFAEVLAAWGDIGSQPAAYVQLSSSPTESDAQASQRGLTARFGSLLTNSLVIEKSDLGTKGAWYRVKMPAGTLADAQRVCSSIRANGGDCIVSGG